MGPNGSFEYSGEVTGNVQRFPASGFCVLSCSFIGAFNAPAVGCSLQASDSAWDGPQACWPQPSGGQPGHSLQSLLQQHRLQRVCHLDLQGRWAGRNRGTVVGGGCLEEAP